MNPFGLELPVFPTSPAAPWGNVMTTWPEYMVDAFQRNVLLLELLRQRGNEEIEITSRPMATVLCAFAHRAAARGRD